MRTIYPNLIIRRKANQEEAALPGGLIVKAATQALDEKVATVVAVSDKSELKVGDTVHVLNVDGTNLNDMDDPYLESVDERNIAAVLDLDGNLIPIRDRVVVKLVEEEEMTPGGIILPDSCRQKPKTYEVVSVGPGKRREDGSFIPMEAVVRARVVMDKYAGVELDKFKRDVLLVKDEEILAIYG